MIEGVMEENKLVQIFLSQSPSPEPGIYEVSLTKNGDFLCTCPGFIAKNNCIHNRFVKQRVKENDGVYPLEISTKCTSEDADKAQDSPEEFRDFIIKYGKIETC